MAQVRGRSQRTSAWARFLAWWGGSSKENPVGRLIMQHKVGQPQWSPRDLSAFAREGYQMNPYVFRAIDQRGKAIGGLRWIAVRRKRGGNIDELDGHPLAELIRRPQPRKGGSRFLYEVEAALCIGGNAFIISAGPTSGENKGKPRELWTLRNDLTKPIPGAGPMMPVSGYEYQSEQGGLIRFEAERVLHLAFYHPQDEFWGMSPLEPGGRSVDHNNAAKEWNVSLLQNSAQPAGSYATEGTLTPQQREELQRQYREERSGPENAGAPMVLEGGLEWTQQGLSPKDMDWLNGTRLSSREIATVYGVPSELLGDADSKTYSNYQEARKAFYQDTVLPEADYIRDELNAFLAGYDAELDYDRDAIEALREDRERLFIYMGAAWQNGLLTKNEARSGLGYDDDPDGDTYIDGGFGEIPNELPEAAPDPEKPDEGEEEPDEDDTDDEESDEDESDDEGLKGLVLTKAARRILLYKSVDKRRKRWVRAIGNSAAKRLATQRRAIIAAIEDAADPGAAFGKAQDVILDQYDAWRGFYKSLYSSVGADFGRVTSARLKADAGPSYTKASEDQAKQVDELVTEWIRRNSGTKIQGILDTDLDRVRAQLAEGVKAGEGVDELAKRVDEYLEPIYAKRAENVARTEVIAASNLGSQMAARATGLAIQKSWLSTPGSRTRPTHSAADGQTVALDHAYTVGGQRMNFPGDHSLGASPDETVSCRCTEIYEAQEGEP